MRGKNEFVETYVLHPHESLADLPPTWKDLLERSKLESVVMIYKDTGSIYKYHIVRRVEVKPK